jgi:hypothetical protein
MGGRQCGFELGRFHAAGRGPARPVERFSCMRQRTQWFEGSNEGAYLWQGAADWLATQ